MGLFKDWEIKNAVCVLKKNLRGHFTELKLYDDPATFLYDDTNGSLVLEAKSTKQLAGAFTLRFTFDEKTCQVPVRKDPTGRSVYLLLLTKENIEALIWRANIFACYLLNHHFRYLSKKGMQAWTIYGERSASGNTAPHLRSYQHPKPQYIETEREVIRRKKQSIHSMEKMWEKITGAPRGNNVSCITENELDTFKLGGKLYMQAIRGQGGLHLIYQEYSILQMARTPRTNYIDLSSDDEPEHIKARYKLTPTSFSIINPSLDLALESASDDDEITPRVKRRFAAVASP